MRWYTDWEENECGEWSRVRRNELGLTEEQEADQLEMQREWLNEEFGEDEP